MKAVDILPGSCTKGLSENVVVRGETSYQMLEVLSFGDRERAQYPSIITIIITTVLYVLIKKVKKAFYGVYLLRIG